MTTERLGNDLSEVASWGVVSGTIQADLRDGRAVAKQVAKLTLFGPEADLDITRDDGPFIQLIKVMAKNYNDAVMADKHEAAAAALKNISGMLSAHEAQKGTRLATAMRLLVEQAKFQAKLLAAGKSNEPTEADLEKMISDQDASAALRAAITASKLDDSDDT